MIEGAEALKEMVGTSMACRALNVPRSSLYRARMPKQAPSPRPTPPRGLKPEEKIMPPGMMETMCNPIAQAEVLNAEQVDLAIMLGLCVGHDTLFLKYIRPPCTVLAVKDRVLGHNPLAAAYLSRGPYYSRLRIESDKTGSGKKVTLPEEVRR